MRVPHTRIRLPRRTARLRLTALYGGLLLLSGVALLAATYVLFEHATQLSTPRLPTVPHAPSIKPLQHKPALPTVKPALPPVFPAQSVAKDSPLPQALSRLYREQHQLSEAEHRLALLPGTPDSQLGPLSAYAELTRDQRQLTQDEHRLAQTVRQLGQAVHQVAQSGSAQRAQRASDSHELLVDSGIALGVVGVVALLAGWLIAGRMLRPIRTITRTARKISSTNLNERLALSGPEDELKELGDTLDDLFARLQASFEAQRSFVANASHELRTPLTRERAIVQVALGDPSTTEVWRSAGEELLASNREQETLIEALLTLASSESELDQWMPSDLADITQIVLARSGFDGDDLDLQIETALAPAPLEGDPRLIERLVANLVDNATRHNLAGGNVRVSTGTTDEKAVLTVTNSGALVPADEIDRLFQPFQRLDPRRTAHKNGHGLGLSIVRAIATAHRATITAQPLAEGGLSLTVAFPHRNPSFNELPNARRLSRSGRRLPSGEAVVRSEARKRVAVQDGYARPSTNMTRADASTES